MKLVPWLAGGMLAGLALATPVRAGELPQPNHCTIPASIRLVGATNGVSDSPAGRFSVVARDIGNNPMRDVAVRVDLALCSDFQLAGDQQDVLLTLDCPMRSVSTRTIATGVAGFTLIGHAVPGAMPSATACARIYADGMYLGSTLVSAFDLDGANGVDIGDLSLWLADLGSPAYRMRSDYDGNGAVTVSDLSAWFGVLGGARSMSSGTACP